jgi:hypothetical protein
VVGAGDILVGAGRARGPLTCPQSRPLGTKNRSERAYSKALEDSVKFESLGVHCLLLQTLFFRVFDTSQLGLPFL